MKTIICSSITSTVLSNSGDCIYYCYGKKMNYLVEQNCALFLFQVWLFIVQKADIKAKSCTELVWTLELSARTIQYKHWCQNTSEYSNKEAPPHLPLFTPKLSPQHLSKWMSNSLQERRVTAQTKKWRSTQQMRHTGRGCWLMCTLCKTKLANILKIDQTLSN